MRRRRTPALCLLIGSLAFSAWPAGSLRKQRPPAASPDDLGMGKLTGGVLTGSLRPMLKTYLWLRADTLYGQERYDELKVLYRTLLTLYPRDVRARTFLGWHLSFNMKGLAATEAGAWHWARDGLDQLVALDAGQETMTSWFLRQCGQNVFQGMRYAGAGWHREVALRKRIRPWLRRHVGSPLSRFRAALYFHEQAELRLPPAEERGLTQTERFRAIERGVILQHLCAEEYVENGWSDTAGEARGAMLEVARLFDEEAKAYGDSDQADFLTTAGDAYRRAAGSFAALIQAAEGDTKGLTELKSRGAPWIANALWGIGVRLAGEGSLGIASTVLRAARSIFQEQEATTYAEEVRLIDRWLEAMVKDSALPPPHPLPLD